MILGPGVAVWRARQNMGVSIGGGPGASDGRFVRRVRHDPGSPVDTTRWPATVPGVDQVLCEGLELPAGLTVLVGENGSGKSTVMEMLAEACGLNPQGGSAQAKLFRTRDSEPGLGAHLIIERGPIAGHELPRSTSRTPMVGSPSNGDAVAVARFGGRAAGQS